MHLNPIIIDLLIYALIIFIIALVAHKKIDGTRDYLLGSRRFSGPVTALGAGASDMSSWLLMALPGAVYLYGLSAVWMPLALLVGAYFNWRLLAPRLRVYTELADNSLTIPEFLVNRFQEHKVALRLVTTLSLICFYIYYSVSGFVSGAQVLQIAFSLDYHTALIITATIIITYTCIGGFFAVNWVDFFQGLLMLTALLSLPIYMFLNVNGSWEYIHLGLQNIVTDSYFNPLQGINVLGIISLFAWGLGYFGQPHISIRFMAIKDVSELSSARKICLTWMGLSLLGAILVGLLGANFLPNIVNQETIFIVLSQKIFNPWIVGIMIAAILSAIMSTVAAMILMLASMCMEDIYKPFIRKNARDKEYLLASKLSVIIISLIPIYIASTNSLSIFQAVGFAWSGLGSSFGPTILLALFWRRMTAAAAIAGISVGAITVILWQIAQKNGLSFFTEQGFLPGIEMLPGFTLSALTIIIVSKYTLHPKNKITTIFDLVAIKLK